MTYRIECRMPNGKWFVASTGLSAVEAHAYAIRYYPNDPTVRVVPERGSL